MPPARSAPVLCLIAISACLSGAKAQSAPQPDSSLKATLLKRGDDMMAAWKAHDRAGLLSTLAPDFVAVGFGGSMTTDLDATIKALMGCELTSYRIADSSLKQLSPTVAVLITRQQQQITCSGHPAPASMDMTDTYVKRDGKWLILIHIETVSQPQ